jgi:hypothetical protein
VSAGDNSAIEQPPPEGGFVNVIGVTKFIPDTGRQNSQLPSWVNPADGGGV